MGRTGLPLVCLSSVKGTLIQKAAKVGFQPTSRSSQQCRGGESIWPKVVGWVEGEGGGKASPWAPGPRGYAPLFPGETGLAPSVFASSS